MAAALVWVTLIAWAEPRAQAQIEGDPEHGAYVFALAGGCGCHDSEAGMLAGGHEYGPFYANNLTSDPETGIGEWTVQELAAAIRIGKDRDGSQLGIMPFDDYSHIADQDAYDLAAFLLATDPIENEVPESDAIAPPFESQVDPPATAPTEGVARGAYIVHVAHCSHCHTPTDSNDMPDMTRYMGGTTHPSWGIVPNLTPDGTGLGSWSEQEIATFLRTLTRPDGSTHEGTMMPGIIKGEGRYEEWSEADALAVATYLKTLEPVTFQPEVGLEAPEAEAPEAEAPEAEAPSPQAENEAGASWILTVTAIVLIGIVLVVAGIFVLRRRFIQG
jgi:mono/diheme cytochrome c family protein